MWPTIQRDHADIVNRLVVDHDGVRCLKHLQQVGVELWVDGGRRVHDAPLLSDAILVTHGTTEEVGELPSGSSASLLSRNPAVRRVDNERRPMILGQGRAMVEPQLEVQLTVERRVSLETRVEPFCKGRRLCLREPRPAGVLGRPLKRRGGAPGPDTPEVRVAPRCARDATVSRRRLRTDTGRHEKQRCQDQRYEPHREEAPVRARPCTGAREIKSGYLKRRRRWLFCRQSVA